MSRFVCHSNAQKSDQIKEIKVLLSSLLHTFSSLSSLLKESSIYLAGGQYFSEASSLL